MSIEQYFLTTDYSLWEVILNDDSPAPTRVVDGVLQPVAPTTAEQKLARKNELKARGTLLMALLDKHQLKFDSHKDAKTLMESLEKRFRGNKETKKVQKTLLKQQYENFTGSSSESLDQIHDRLQKLISQLEIHRVALSQEDVNLNTTKPVSVAASVSTVCAKMPMSSHPNVDSLSNAVIYSFFASQSSSPQLDNEDLKQIDSDDLEEMDLKWQMAMEYRSPKDSIRNGAAEPQRRNVPSFQAEEEPANYAFIAFSSSSSSSDNEVVSCSKACLESVEARLLVYKQNEYVFEENIQLLKLEVQLKDNALVTLRQKLKKAEQERDDLKLKLEKFQASSKNLTELLASQTNEKTGLGYNSPVFTRAMFDCDDYFSSKSNESWPPSSLYDRFQPSDGYHAIPPPYTGTFMPPKPDLVFNTAPTTVETDHSAFNVQLSPTKPDQDLSLTNRPSAPIIKDWVSDSEDESKTTAPRIVLSFVQSTKQVKSPRYSVQHVETSIPTATPKPAIPNPTSNGKRRNKKACFGNPQHALKDKGDIDSGCSRQMAGNMSYLSDFEELNGGYVAFGGNPKGGKIRTCKLNFDDVYFVKELKFNLFSVSQMCDKKNSVLFTNTECLVLSPDFKLPDESQVLLRVPRENNMYNVNLKNIIPSGDLTCLFAKATLDESNLWHGRLGHINFKTMNKLVKDDYSRFTWVFFLATKDETSPILKTFITGLENQLSLKVKVIRSDNGTEFKNNDLSQFYGMKGIKREFSIPRTPQQNGIAERKNRTLIEAARTMLADSLLPIPFWVEAVNTACYVQNRVLVTKPHNNTPYGLLHGRKPSIGFMRPFGCLVTILNTLDSLGKFDGKVDEEFLVGYYVSSKAFRVFNSRTRIVQETLHVNFLENKPNVVGSGPTWLFDIDSLTKTMNYQPVTAGNQSNFSAGFQEKIDAEKAREEGDQQYVLFPVWSSGSTNPQNTDGDAAFDGKEPEFDEKKLESAVNVSPSKFKDYSEDSINEVNDADTLVLAVRQISPNSTNTFSAVELEDITYSNDEDDVGAEADFNNLETSITVSPIPTIRVHKDHHVTQIIGDLSLATQTRSMARVAKDQGDTKSASTPIDTEKPLLKGLDVYACARFQVTQKASHLHAVKRIFRYLKDKPHLGLWYLKDSPFDLVAYLDSDYAGASLDRKSTTRGCQFLGCRLISWQCKKQTVVATSSTKVEYVAAASCCAQVLWIQNQLLDYGYNNLY
nr:putative ribonuclease H-like domain-containing protein [Tanacetum cinerariifolium]